MKRTILLTLAVLTLGIVAGARQPDRGYRGFVEWSNSLRSENFGYLDINGNIYMQRDNMYYTGIATSHGYQINSIFFAGAGLDLEYCGNIDNWIASLYVQGRADMKFGGFTPYGDIRLGANLAEGVGVYFSPTIGYRFNWGRKVGINVGAGLSLTGYTSEHYDIVIEDPDSYNIYYTGTKHHVRAYFSFRLGVDF